MKPIDLLVARKFPRPINSFLAHNRRGLAGDWSEESHPLYEEIKKYRKELGSKTPEEINALYYETLRQEADTAEKNRFFNRPSAIADFEHWTKATYWTLDEAISLALGKNPRVVNRKTMNNKSLQDANFYMSPFVDEYNKLNDLAERAKNWTQLYDPIIPSLFIAWAKKTDISIPQDLERLVIQRSGKLIDWKKQYDDLLEKNNENVKIANDAIAVQMAHIKSLEAKNEELNLLLHSTKKDESTSIETKAKIFSTKERETLLKLIIGMAMGGYGYDPTVSKSSTTTEIYNDLVTRGMSLDQDTIRKKLKEGLQFVDTDKTEIK